MSKKACHVLFICTGNLCRSPMAEGILKKILKAKGIQDIEVRSAGMMALNGAPATQLTQAVSLRNNVDLSQHVAQFVSAEFVSNADLIFVMEKVHQKEIEDWFHPNQNKVFLLKAYGQDGMDEEVDDPMGGNQEVFELCFQCIESEIRRIFPELLEKCRKGG